MLTHTIEILRKINNQCPRSISHGGASLLKFSSRNSIALFLNKTYFTYFAHVSVVLNLDLSDESLFVMRT